MGWEALAGAIVVSGGMEALFLVVVAEGEVAEERRWEEDCLPLVETDCRPLAFREL